MCVTISVSQTKEQIDDVAQSKGYSQNTQILPSKPVVLLVSLLIRDRPGMRRGNYRCQEQLQRALVKLQRGVA